MRDLTRLLVSLQHWLNRHAQQLDPVLLGRVNACLAEPLSALPAPALRSGLSLADSWQAARHNAVDLDEPMLQSLDALAPVLNWWSRPVSAADPAGFQGAHANAILIGARGLAQSPNLTLGISLMEAGIRYPMHQHPPHEIYFVLSEGEWYQEGNGWSTPGIGGLVYNPPDILHAMRAGDQPLLALWVLLGDLP